MIKTTLVEIIYIAIITVLSLLAITQTNQNLHLKWDNQELKTQIQCIEKQGIWQKGYCFYGHK